MAEKVTLDTIAKACHLSVGTVSRALNDRPDIAAETKEMVMRTAQELGYRKGGGEITPLRIGVVYCRERADFYDEVTQGIQKARQELTGRSVTVDLLQTDRLDQDTQAELLAGLDPAVYDGLIVNAAGVQTAGHINRFVDAGVPVATFNTDAPSSRRLYYVGCNYFIAGQVAAHLLGKLVGGKGKVLLVGSILGKSAWVDRFSSAYAVLNQEFPDVEICPVLRESLSSDASAESALEFLQANGDVTGILPINNNSTCAMIQALRALGRKDIRMVGFDITRETRAGVLEGYCDAVLFQDPFQQGYLSVSAMVQYLTRGTAPQTEEISIPPNIVMKYNIDAY